MTADTAKKPNPATDGDPFTFTVFNEIGIIEQLARTRFNKALPDGMQVSHFTVLNHFARLGGEKSPVQLARAFQVTKGAMTNTLQRLERAGYIQIRPDGVDGRKKLVSITPEGLAMRNRAIAAMAPHFALVTETIGQERLRAILPTLRDLRILLDETR